MVNNKIFTIVIGFLVGISKLYLYYLIVHNMLLWDELLLYKKIVLIFLTIAIIVYELSNYIDISKKFKSRFANQQ
jgi:hypothetical protein